ncbi:MAG: tetratricopeptide repeat protein [Candidatus Omnitrophota bacterium]
MAGFSLFLVSMTYYFIGNKTHKLTAAVLLIIISGYSVLTYARNSVWRNELTLWNDVVCKSPGKLRLYNERGNAYRKIGRLDEAIADFNKAIKINPKDSLAYNNRGLVYMKRGLIGKAISDYNRAIKLNPLLY